jgi:hypothetical protein
MAFVVVGLVCVVGATIAAAVATSDDPGSKLPIYVGAGSVAVFLVLLLAYQWLGIALARRRDGGGSMSGVVVRNQVMVTLMGLACALGGILWVLGVNAAWYPLGDTGPGLPLAFAPVLLLIPVALLSMGTNVRSAVAASDEQLRPLGLKTVSLPRLVILPGIGDSTHLVGGTVVAGRRHGRYVEVVFEGRGHTIAIEGDFRPLARTEHGAEVEAGPDGLVLRRRKGGADRWLDDLRVAEECADAVSRAPAG